MDNINTSKQSMHYDANKKSVGVAYVLWFLFGGFGAHRFYLSRIGTGVLMLVLFIGAFLTAGILGIPLAIWLIIDAFLIPDMVRSYNNQLIEMLTSDQDRTAAPATVGTDRYKQSNPSGGDKVFSINDRVTHLSLGNGTIREIGDSGDSLMVAF